MNPLFVVIIIISALSIFRGWRRGIVGLAYGVISWIFILAFVGVANPMLYRYFMENEPIREAVYDRIYPLADAYVPKSVASEEMPEREAEPGRLTLQSTNRSRVEGNADAHAPVASQVVSDYLGVLQEYLKENGYYDEKNDTIHIDKELIDNLDLDIPEEIEALIPEKGLDVPASVLEEMKKNGGIRIPSKYKFLVGLLESQGVDVSGFVDSVNNKLEDTVVELREKAVARVAEEATDRILKVLALLITYIIAKLICVIARLSLKLITIVPPVNFLVKAAGAAVGAVEALLYIWVILFVIALVRPSPIGGDLYEQVEENPLLETMYEVNPLTEILGRQE
ncbi:MAG: hypothetical protein IJV04_02890 [Lachnospiraceae bacterium]|nr:hypothetical protein [Lachnospiraceae bacterium]